MMKHIQNHSHAFLFFLGGLFLMLVGPSLIPFSNAATVTATTVAANLEQTIQKNMDLLNNAEAKQLSGTELVATMNIVANILIDIEKITDTDIEKAKTTIHDLLNILKKLRNKNTKADNTIDITLGNLIEDLNNTWLKKTKGAIKNNLKKAQKNFSNNNKATNIEEPNTANTNTTNTMETYNSNRGSKVRILRKESYRYNENQNLHAAAGTSTQLEPIYYSSNNLNFITTTQALAGLTPLTKDATLIQTVQYFQNLFVRLYEALFQNIKNLFSYIQTYEATLQYQQNQLDALKNFIKEANLGTSTQRDELDEKLNNFDKQYNQQLQPLNATTTQPEHKKHSSAANNNPTR